MLLSLREETEGKLQMLLSLRKTGLTSLFKEVRVFKVFPNPNFHCYLETPKNAEKCQLSCALKTMSLTFAGCTRRRGSYSAKGRVSAF